MNSLPFPKNETASEILICIIARKALFVNSL